MKTVLKNFIRRYLWLHFRIRNSRPVWYLLNREGQALYRKHPAQLDAVGQQIVSRLRTTGFAVSHLDELFPGTDWLPRLQRYADQLLPQAQTKGDKPFLRYLWEPVPTLEAENPFVWFALQRRVVDIANAYLRMCARFYFFTLNQTVPRADRSIAKGSQRWHRDYEDKQMCKLFLYLNDVSDGAGPFIYIPGSTYRQRWGNVFPQRPPLGSYPDEAEVRELVREEPMVLTGRAGTILFCDTSGLHRGGQAVSSPRLMFTAGYRSNASPSATRFRWSQKSGAEWDQIQADPVLYYAATPRPAIPSFRLFKRLSPEQEY